MWQSFFGTNERSYDLIQEHESTICVSILADVIITMINCDFIF